MLTLSFVCEHFDELSGYMAEQKLYTNLTLNDITTVHSNAMYESDHFAFYDANVDCGNLKVVLMKHKDLLVFRLLTPMERDQ